MDQCTHEVRAQYWKNIIQSCQQRPAGLSAKKWLDKNGICEQSYYSWLRRLRQETYLQIKQTMVPVSSVKDSTDVTFAEFTLHH